MASSVTVVDHAIARGQRLQDLLTDSLPDGEDLDLCQALVWRISVLNDPAPTEEDLAAAPDLHPHQDEDNPFWDDAPPAWAPTEQEWATLPAPDVDELADTPDPLDPEEDYDEQPAVTDDEAFGYLAWAAEMRRFAGPLQPSDRQIQTQLSHAYEADTASVSPARILERTRLALAYYTDRYSGSWAQTYLTDRVGHRPDRRPPRPTRLRPRRAGPTSSPTCAATAPPISN